MSCCTPTQTNRTLGLSLWTLAVLALLAAPRVVLHDLGLATGGPVAGLLALGPPAVWIAAVLIARCPRPLLTLLVVGVGYGCILAIGHNLFWDEVFDEVTPRLGGNLEGELSPTVEELLMRAAMTVSSVFTGVAVGLVCGLVALMLRALGRLVASRRSEGRRCQ
jgi:hypothetical protein